jgi:hypothetical protein
MPTTKRLSKKKPKEKESDNQVEEQSVESSSPSRLPIEVHQEILHIVSSLKGRDRFSRDVCDKNPHLFGSRNFRETESLPESTRNQKHSKNFVISGFLIVILQQQQKQEKKKKTTWIRHLLLVAIHPATGMSQERLLVESKCQVTA